jgi:hypothetical protein
MHACHAYIYTHLEQRDLASEPAAQAAMHPFLIEARQHMILLLEVFKADGAIADACGHLVQGYVAACGLQRPLPMAVQLVKYMLWRYVTAG